MTCRRLVYSQKAKKSLRILEKLGFFLPLHLNSSLLQLYLPHVSLDLISIENLKKKITRWLTAENVHLQQVPMHGSHVVEREKWQKQSQNYLGDQYLYKIYIHCQYSLFISKVSPSAEVFWVGDYNV